MIIIGVDYHPSDQYIAFVDTETGEYGERQLNHSAGEADPSRQERNFPYFSAPNALWWGQPF
jgi:hypothetical protein